MFERFAAFRESRGHIASALLATAAAILVATFAMRALSHGGGLTANLFVHQDFPLLMLGSAVLLALALRAASMSTVRLPRPPILVGVLAFAVLLAAGAGTWLVFGNVPLTRDEIMANFDAAFLARGRLIAPVPPEWRPFAAALNPQFMLPIPAAVGWLSDYLPGNAALRAIGLRTVGAEWTSPLLAAVSIFAVYRIGRRLWPESPGNALVAALLMASSAQFLIMAMTAYAMTAHLAFNLLWLWCFLRADRRGDAGAFLCGFVATGLHQLVFHPLFVVPFIIELWHNGQRRRALAYVGAYAAIGLFWASYWQILLAGAGAPEATGSAGSVGFLLGRVLELIGKLDAGALATMTFNLLRFVAWQNLVLVPFALLAWPSLRRGEGISRPLAGGLLLTGAAALVLMPWQGLGWGFRYFHGLIGSLCLLAGYGWASAAGESGRRNLVIAAGTSFSLLVMLPMQTKFAYDYAAPRVRASAAVAQASEDVVIIVPAEDWFDDLVRNAPDLSNRPLVLDLRRLSPRQIELLCSRYRVGFFDIRHGMRVGLPGEDSAELMQRYSVPANRLGCANPLPVPSATRS